MNLTQDFLLVTKYLMSLSLKFHMDLSFYQGENCHKKSKYVKKNRSFFGSLVRHPLWPNDMATTQNCQAEMNVTFFTSWDTFIKSQDHCTFSNLVTLKSAKVCSSAIWHISHIWGTCHYCWDKIMINSFTIFKPS